MITLPTGWAALLTATTVKPVIVYELELAAGTLRYSDQAVTWSSNAYTALAVKSSPFSDYMDPSQVGRVTVTFDNVSRTLLTQLTGDLIYGRFMRIRLLLYSGGSLDTNSVTLFRGIMQRPRRISETSLDIEVNRPPHGTPTPIPGQRRFSRGCEWDFASAGAYDGTGRCPYQQSTTSTNSGTASTGPVTLTNGAMFVNGDEIVLGSQTKVAIAAGGGTNSITLAAARTWSASGAVRFANCSREIPDCELRVMTHRYGGFRGSEDKKSLQAAIFQDKINSTTGPWGDNPKNIAKWKGEAKLLVKNMPEGQPLEDLDSSVPLVYGRRLVSGQLVEVSGIVYTSGGPLGSYMAAVYGLSEGTIDSIVNAYVGNSLVVQKVTSNRKVYGHYYRAGGDGVEDEEDEADYAADPTTLLRAQKRDFYTGTGDTLSHTSYATFIQKLQEVEAITPDSAEFDLKAIKVQKYTSGGAVSGGVVWSATPIWHAVDLLTQDYATGKMLDAADIDFSVSQPSAVYCEVVVYGLYNSVVATTDEVTAGTEDVWEVDKTDQYTRGMTVEVDENGTLTESTVTNVLTSTKVQLAYAKVTPTAPARIRPKIPRYSCHAVLDSPQRAGQVVADILATCNGYITYDESGRLQLRIEGSDTAASLHFKDTGYDAGYAILECEPLDRDDGEDVNRVVGRYRSQENEDREALANDWDHRRTHVVSARTINYQHVDNGHQAYRLSKLVLDKARVLGVGALLTVGPAGLQVQPGDLISVTHADLSWTAKTVRVVKTERVGIGDDRELFTRMEVRDYSSAIYTDSGPPATTNVPGNQDEEPDLNLAATPIPGGKVELVWTNSAGNAQGMSYRIYKSDATMAGAPEANGLLVAKLKALQFSYIYQAPNSEIGSTLYFQIVAGKSIGAPFAKKILSDEVPVVVAVFDPTDTQFTPGLNTGWDGAQDNPDDWELLPEVSPTEVKPTTDSAGSGGGYLNPTNAYDSDDVTFARASVSSGGGAKSHSWGLPGVTAGVSGYFAVDCKGGGVTQFQSFGYSIDNGGSYIPFGYSAGQRKIITSPVITGDRDKLRVRATATNGGATTFGAAVYEITWVESAGASTPSATMANGVTRLVGDGATVYGEARRAWPGKSGSPDTVVPSGSVWTAQIKFKRDESGASPTEPLQFFLLDGLGTYHELTSVSAGTFDPDPAQWKEQAMLWTAPGTLVGPFMWGCRSLSTVGVEYTHIMLLVGNQIGMFAGHPGEDAVDPTNKVGTHDGFPRGPWNGTPKVTTVSL